jgi:hypothetical protein
MYVPLLCVYVERTLDNRFLHNLSLKPYTNVRKEVLGSTYEPITNPLVAEPKDSTQEMPRPAIDNIQDKFCPLPILTTYFSKIYLNVIFLFPSRFTNRVLEYVSR